MTRPTISDVARAAGVSKGAVSYALNGRPGVSEATRRRILAAADALGFHADRAARALAGAPAKTVGLTLYRPARTLGVEPFFMELISGLEAELSLRSYALLLHMVADREQETAVYRRWGHDHAVDGVLVCDVLDDDPRLPVLRELGLPAVVIGPFPAGGRVSSVWSDDAVSLQEAVEYLVALGHRRIGRVAGIPDLAHTRIRCAAFANLARKLRLECAPTEYTDYTGPDGARATRLLLGAADPPTALVYDNDIMAVAGLAVAQEMGLTVPGDLSVVAWDDSPVCRIVHPALTALTRDIAAYGRQAAQLLLASLDGREATGVSVEAAHLTPRASTAGPANARPPA
ncbi:LacI family transcriptional regulator [Kitasatospora herbaricolor]|uniref:LacI family DNA-binding transcriptional regulator n=1 Tax=Kitasatospora herbaricolor TaxID=68217 RepID=UPI00174A9669|nr:LacI family DNA-binding transcriptional regulator [Kitasatospora herbaricolor]MDQ0306742.1 DNA-binding LacI/PurR family transcriptional regulator [Kitasatospora herbaricolor]GGV44527.1 LacI family transcriptional regulator [Kitasatospora herbaricolor]